MKIYEQHHGSILVQEEDYAEMQRYIFAQNRVIPKEIWPREGIQPDVRQDDEIYYERIKSASNQHYYELCQAQKEQRPRHGEESDRHQRAHAPPSPSCSAVTRRRARFIDVACEFRSAVGMGCSPDGEVRICSSFDATQLFFNHSCKEFRELRNSYNSKLTPLRCIQSGTRLSAANLDLTQGSTDVTGLDDFEEGLGVDGAVVPLKRCLFKEFDRCGSSKKLKDMVVKQEK
nr:replication protein A 70 kDa DNA-binding subunit B-like [Ipomoea trifida]